MGLSTNRWAYIKAIPSRRGPFMRWLCQPLWLRNAQRTLNARAILLKSGRIA